jgi:hypothetical protein
MVDENKPKISDYDITVYNIKRNNMFKGTVLMCIIYAIFAFILIISAYVSENIKTLLFERFLPFTLIYIIGTIVIILIFVGLIFSFKPEKIDNTSEYPRVSCPDYWKLELVDDYDTKTLFDTQYDNDLFKYKCVMDKNIHNNYNIFINESKSNDNTSFRLTNFNSNLINSDFYNNATSGSNMNNYNDFNNHYNIYKDINSYDYTASPFNNIIDDNFNNAKLHSNLIIASFGMNNYKIDNNNYKQIHDKINYNSYNIQPIAWNYNKVSDSNVYPVHPNIPANNISVLVNWNNLTYDKYIDVFGNKKSYVHNINSANNASTILGSISVNKENNNLLYKSESSIAKANLNNISSYSSNMYSGYISNKSTAVSSSTADVTAIKNETLNYNIEPLKLIIYDNSNITSIDSTKTSGKIIPLVCDKMYPAFLAYMDDKDESKNKLRCAYSKICGVTWSDMNCKS